MNKTPQQQNGYRIFQLFLKSDMPAKHWKIMLNPGIDISALQSP